MNSGNERVSTVEAAKRLGVSRGGLSKMRMAGKGPVFFKIGGKVSYSIADLDAWLEQCRRTQSTPVMNHWKRRKGEGEAKPQAA